MHAAVCLLRAGQPRSASDAAKLGQFIGQFSWVTGDPIGVKGLTWIYFNINFNKPFFSFSVYFPVCTIQGRVMVEFVAPSCDGNFNCTALQ